MVVQRLAPVYYSKVLRVLWCGWIFFSGKVDDAGLCLQGKSCSDHGTADRQDPLWRLCLKRLEISKPRAQVDNARSEHWDTCHDHGLSCT